MFWFWLGLLALIAAAALEVFRWRRTLRLFGQIPAWLPRQMFDFARASRFSRFVNAVLLLLTLTPMVLVLSPVVVGTPVLEGLGLLDVAVAISILSRCCQPPAALLLTSSSERTPAFLGLLNAVLSPLRVVALFERRGGGRPRLVPSLDNLRTSDSRIWKSVVNRLVDIAPIVIIDTSGDPKAVAHEVSIVLEAGRLRKTLFLLDESGRYPALSANGIDPHQHAFRLMTTARLIETLKHCSRGRDYLPWPPDLPASCPWGHLRPEVWETLPSVLVIADSHEFDSASLLRTAINSGRDLLQVPRPWTRLSTMGWEYTDLIGDFHRDPRLAAMSMRGGGLLIVRIAFLQAHGSELAQIAARAHQQPLTFEQLNEPDPVSTAQRTWEAELGRVARRHGWRTREVAL